MASQIFPRLTDKEYWTPDRLKKQLFKSAMQRKWDDVLEIYKKNPKAHWTKITRSGDTALHIAVSDNRKYVVDNLVKLIHYHHQQEVIEASYILLIANDKGNTPLHLAASIGNVGMCLCIARGHEELVDARNNDGETPLFLAALHGKKEAFLCLHDLCDPRTLYDNSRRGDGETILHSAISGEYFDLAYQIIRRCPHLIYYVDEIGSTPLHLLAGKPAAFKSGSTLNWFDKIIYHCLSASELNDERFHHYHIYQTVEHDKWEGKWYPKNYQTCMSFVGLLLRPWLLASAPYRRSNSERISDQKYDVENPEPEQGDINAHHQKLSGGMGMGREKRKFPHNYRTCFDIIKWISKAPLIILGLGFKAHIRRLEMKKQKQAWAAQIMDELISHTSLYAYNDGGDIPEQSEMPYNILDGDVIFHEDVDLETQQSLLKGKWKMEKQEKPILIAAKNGILEMVERILEIFPVAIHDTDHHKKNIVLLAAEHRQPHLYRQLLRKVNLSFDSAFGHVDEDSNSALHLVAKLGYAGAYPFPAVQMQWELKWYQFVRRSVPRNHFVRYNKEGKTAKEIFRESHQELASKAGEWLNNISNSCSVVATLVAAVSFATTATAPGGIKEESSKPTFERHPGFLIYAVSSLIALVFSVTSMVTFLAILTARRKMEDFEKRLPRKLLLGLTCLFISIGAMLVCFCGAHYFLLKDVLEDSAFTVYALACLPTTIFAVAQFPFYFVLLSSTFQVVPQRQFTY